MAIKIGSASNNLNNGDDGKTIIFTATRYSGKRFVFKKITPFNKLEASRQKEYNLFYSVIIPTYNRSSMLKMAVSSVLSQTLSPAVFEVLVIDDGSAGEDTKNVVLEFKKEYPQYNIKYFYQVNAGPSAARNLGIKEARGDIIFFTDDDCVVPPDWMETILDGYKKYPEISGAGGWYMPSKEELARNVVAKFFYYISFLHDSRIGPFLLHHEILSNDPMVCFETFAYNTANMSFRRSILERVGGFREEFRRPGYEDNDLALRVFHGGGSILYLPSHVTHSSHLDVSSFAKLYFSRGVNYRLFLRLNKNILEDIGHGLSRRNSYTPLTLLRHLWHRPYRLMTVIRFFAFRLGNLYEI